MFYNKKIQVIIINIENQTACPTIHKEITLNIDFSLLYKSNRTTEKNFFAAKKPTFIWFSTRTDTLACS